MVVAGGGDDGACGGGSNVGKLVWNYKSGGGGSIGLRSAGSIIHYKAFNPWLDGVFE